eukprot:XP_011418590.1 PREDICTED: uncharacterized protein LOC105321829 [Crassostrea gigas]
MNAVLLFTILSVKIAPTYQQNDSLCSTHSPSAKHYASLNYCYWLTPSSQTADDGALTCEAAGGYMGYIDSTAGLLNFINEGLDNHWSFHNQSVFVGLRSWTENNAFTHWDSSPIYTFKWDYTNGQPDGIAFLQFCVTLYPDPPHLWHNTRCDSLFQSLCYCHLSGVQHTCSVPINASVTSPTFSTMSTSFLVTSPAGTSLTPSPPSDSSIVPWSIPVSSNSDYFYYYSYNSIITVTTGSTYLCPSSTSWTHLTVTSTVFVTSYVDASSIMPSLSSDFSSYSPTSSTHNVNSTMNATSPSVDLRVDKTSTSRYQRTKYSAGDERPLSQFLGTTAIITIVAIIGIIIAGDMITIAQQVKAKLNQWKRKLEKEPAKLENEACVEMEDHTWVG